ncbi:MAG: hypothetical protein ACR2HD_05310 [Solirubrobacteraceae bacterium]
MTDGEHSTDTDAAADPAEKNRELDEKMKKLEEEGPPERLEDWPDELKTKTFGGREGDHGYNEGPETQLGPSEVVHREDGSVTVAGEQVDDPEKYKGDPIPGGPTDPNSPTLSGEGDAKDGEGDAKDG